MNTYAEFGCGPLASVLRDWLLKAEAAPSKAARHRCLRAAQKVAAHLIAGA
jgi:hypothetical protein